MVTKGFIVEKVGEDSNKFLVRLPVFESVGDVASEEVIYEATVSYVPGNLNTYRPGDCVFVGFEDNDTAKAIILGKLYMGDDEEAVSSQNAQTLSVSGTSQLSKDTYIGNKRIDQIFASQAQINIIEEQLKKQITYRVLDIE